LWERVIVVVLWSWVLALGLLIPAGVDLVELTGPGGQRIYINPQEVTDVRDPTSQTHFARGTRCLIFLTSRNFVAVVEPCAEVRSKLRGQ
jgi:hypothetical protein